MVAEDLSEPAEPTHEAATKKTSKIRNESARRKFANQLREVKAWNTPLVSPDAGGVSACVQKFASSCAERGSQMPLWVEVLLNVIGYGGFVAIAIYHRPSGGDLPTDKR